MIAGAINQDTTRATDDVHLFQIARGRKPRVFDVRQRHRATDDVHFDVLTA
jgi:hypothetical protein